MMISKVEICGVNTSKLPVLKEKEMKSLLLAMHNGDPNARETFIKGNLRLVLSVIQRFNNRGENVDDLFQVGCIGLMKAIDNFDLSRSVGTWRLQPSYVLNQLSSALTKKEDRGTVPDHYV